MELRHLRYFLAVGEALSFTKASSHLRVAQPALSRQVQDLEREIGVELFKRSPRGVTLTAEGRLFLDLARDLLKRADESMDQVRSFARGHHGELHVGYAASPSVEIMPPALAAFQKAFPHVNVRLHDGSRRELIEGLHQGAFQLAIMPKAVVEGIEFETLRAYPLRVAFAPGHAFGRLKSVPLEKMAAEPLVALARREYPEYHHFLNSLFSPLGRKPRIAVECDNDRSLITAVESGQGVALGISVFKLVSGKRLVYRPLTRIDDLVPVGIARAKGGEVTSAGETFCEILRSVAKGTAGGSKAATTQDLYGVSRREDVVNRG
jgi:DNA-binding transcriptional LysR family regulator